MVRQQINLGIAVDVAGKDGARSLMVPNIKNAGALNFQEYVTAFDDLVAARPQRQADARRFPGHHHFAHQSRAPSAPWRPIPRLMPGQGAIIAAGAIDYPAEYQGARRETRAMLGISKVMTLTCTYDHRIIQGAESGMFLGKLQALLDGDDGFYEEVFEHLRMPHHAGALGDRTASRLLPGMTAARYAEIAKEAAIIQLINAYRVRGHLIADLDPLGAEPSYHAELDPDTYGLTIWDLDREFLTGSLGEAIGEGAPKAVATLREILETLRQTYCGKIGCEYMNIQVPEQKRWLQQRMEPEANNWPLDRETRVRILRALIDGRRVRALPALPLRGPEALRARRRRNRARDSGRNAGARRRPQRARNRDRHGAPRPPERAGQHRRQGRQADLLASSKATSIPPARRARAT